MKNVITNKVFDEERALYNLCDCVVKDCTFAGEADGESVLKETHRIEVAGCNFSLRYPLWHSTEFVLSDSALDSLTRAPIWYSADGKISNCVIDGIKCLRECDRISLVNCKVKSPEFGWRCRELCMIGGTYESEYFLFESENVKISDIGMSGKYSFQYTKNLEIDNCMLDTKDAFWHAKNVTVRNSTVKGEYLGWFSEGLTLIGCKIIGTQPLCYCKNLKLIDCTMEQTDLSFEYSDVEAEISGNIVSVKNPSSGKIVADSIGEIILENSVYENNCKIIIR